MHRQLKTLTETHPNLTDVSQALFGDDTTASAHYQNAVFAMTAANLIDVRLSTDATKEAADRQTALDDKVDSLNEQARNSIEMLKQTDSGYSFSLV
ncbi:MAG: head completion/stabilization protein [Hydrogenovibrio crunogenus]|nr:head completion/stabilization protein [Hydrogenovibrio crunogenus]